MKTMRGGAAAVLALAMVLAGLPGAAQSPSPTFSDVTRSAGIHFVHNSGAAGKKFLPETMGSGGAFLDVDNDGWQDVFLVQSKNWPGRPGSPSLPALYRNNGNG